MTSLSLRAPLSGWLCPLEEVPDAVFAGRLLGDGLAIDPLAGTVHAPADGEVIVFHEAGHAVTLRLDGGVEVLIHFGLETVRLKGAGFTQLVALGDRVKAGDPLLRVDLASVGLAAKSLVTPLVITEAAGHGVSWTALPGRVAVGDVLATLSPAGTAAAVETVFAASARRELRVPLAHGLHARPSARLAEVARGFDARVRVASQGREAALASPSAMLRLAVRHGDTIALLADGPEAEAALAALADLIAGGMGEGAPLPDPAAAAKTITPAAPAREARKPVAALLPGESARGVSAAPGLAVGVLWIARRAEPAIVTQAQGPALEEAALDQALAGLRDGLLSEVAGAHGAQRAILEAHLGFLDDPELLGAARARIAAGASAGTAWRAVLHGEAEALRAAGDARFAERADDMIDLELRLQWQLLGEQPPVAIAPEGAILVADDLLPSQVAALDTSRVVGLATARGGPTSHVAIIAASRGLPCVVALGEGILGLAEGTPLVLDGGAALLEAAPSPERLAQARAEVEARAARKARVLAAAQAEARTACGTRIEVFANLGKLADAAPALTHGAEGCGLLRTEFLFLDRASAPDEDEQTADYAAIAAALAGRPLIIRLLDIGGDKPAPYLPIDPEENPALGLRGIRVGLDRPDVLTTQLRAILRAAEKAPGPVKIMVPMIARLAELEAVRVALEAQAFALGLPMPSLGVMVETPAAAVMADALAAQCDFLSVGTNDLTQYALAMDRGNPAVAGGIDGLDPSVLRLIGQTCRGGAAHDKWVGVCGGLASDPLAVPILIGLGVTELSAAPAQVSEIKALVAALTMDQCRGLAQAALSAATANDVRAAAAALLKEIGL